MTAISFSASGDWAKAVPAQSNKEAINTTLIGFTTTSVDCCGRVMSHLSTSDANCWQQRTTEGPTPMNLLNAVVGGDQKKD